MSKLCQSCCENEAVVVRLKESKYCLFNIMIFYLPFLNATAFYLLIVLYNIVLQFSERNYIMTKVLVSHELKG